MSTRRPTIGSNPLDALLSDTPTSPATTRPVTPSTRPTAAPVAAPSTRRAPRIAREREPVTTATRTKATYLLPAAVVDRARNAAVALAAPPVRLTLAALVTEAITREVDRLERTHNRGKAFPHFGAPLVGGRPLKARDAERGPRKR